MCLLFQDQIVMFHDSLIVNPQCQETFFLMLVMVATGLSYTKEWRVQNSPKTLKQFIFSCERYSNTPQPVTFTKHIPRTFWCHLVKGKSDLNCNFP